MRFIDFFAGIGGFRRGLELSGHKCVGFCEWDRFATASYTSMHLLNEDQRKKLEKMTLKQRQKEILKDEYRNGEWYASDIRNVETGDIPESECWCFGAPCQDFSIAGKRAGLNGDRSSLIREIFRLLEEQEEESRPEWLIYENVKGMLSSNRGLDYLSILSEMDRLGYDVEWQNLHTEWFLPQHRERIYTVGHLRARGRAEIFPITGTNGENSIYQIGSLKNDSNRNKNQYRVYDQNGCEPTLNCMGGGGLEPHIGIKVIGNTNPSGKGMNGNVFYENGIAPTVGTNKGEGSKIGIEVIGGIYTNVSRKYQRGIYNGMARSLKAYNNDSGIVYQISDIPEVCIKVKEATKKGYAEASEGDSINLSVTESKTHRDCIGKQIAQTLDTECNHGVIVKLPIGYSVYALWYEKYKSYIAIRKLTPKECFRLQGWSDDYYEKAAFVNSDSQLYKQAGNGATVDVVAAIGEKIYEIERMV